MIYDYDCDDDDNNNDHQHHTDMEKERKLLFWNNFPDTHPQTVQKEILKECYCKRRICTA